VPLPYLLCSDVLCISSGPLLLTSVESMQFLGRSQLRLSRFDFLLSLEDILGEGRIATEDRVGRLTEILVQTQSVFQ
ncbi:hypothetical protein PENTCL1PPCAC_1162, partial [Pristionchus entomophagus]